MFIIINFYWNNMYNSKQINKYLNFTYHTRSLSFFNFSSNFINSVRLVIGKYYVYQKCIRVTNWSFLYLHQSANFGYLFFNKFQIAFSTCHVASAYRIRNYEYVFKLFHQLHKETFYKFYSHFFI